MAELANAMSRKATPVNVIWVIFDLCIARSLLLPSSSNCSALVQVAKALCGPANH
jgi:hypothetical protein